MLRINPKQKINLLLAAILTAITYSVVTLLIKYFRHDRINLIELLTGALIFFVVFYLLSQVFYRIRLKKQEKDRSESINNK